MSPQPTAAPEQTMVDRQIGRSLSLEKERGELMKRIAGNREFLRIMSQAEELSEEQEDFLDDMYPQKEKGQKRTDAEVERTRKVKAAARAGALTIADVNRLAETVTNGDAPDDDDDE